MTLAAALAAVSAAFDCSSLNAECGGARSPSGPRSTSIMCASAAVVSASRHAPFSAVGGRIQCSSLALVAHEGALMGISEPTPF